MKTIEMLAKRNMKLYLRDRTTVLFSMLTIIIIIVLNVVFLGKLNVDNIIANNPISEKDARYFVDTWVLAGIIYTSTLTVTLAVIGVMIDDEEQKRMKAFYTAPVKRLELTLGYIVSAFIMGFIMSMFTLFISKLYLYFTGNPLLDPLTLMKLIGVIVFNVFFNACLVFFFVSMLKTASSFSALNIILGTLIGFIAGIYLPIGMLPNVVRQVLSSAPFLHGASLIRRFYTKDSLALIFDGAPSNLMMEYSDYMGITINRNGTQTSLIAQFSFLFICAILCIILSAFVLSKKNGNDR